MEADHQRGRKRPGLGGVVAHLADADSRLLVHLAGHRLLQAFARFDEPGQRRIHARRPDLLPAKKRPVAVMDQHDHGRIGAREMAGPAIGIGAAADMPRLGALGRRPADPAEAVACMPPHEPAGVSEKRALLASHQRADAPQVGPFADAGGAALCLLLAPMRDVDGEVQALAALAQHGARRCFVEP